MLQQATAVAIQLTALLLPGLTQVQGGGNFRWQRLQPT